jgi:hypothetical protein
LPIQDGYDIKDNNLLACPRTHVEAVLDMLQRQREPAAFTGGIDARLCEPWFAERLGRMRVSQLYTAYDHAGQKSHVERTIRMLAETGLAQRKIGCYVLVGHCDDTLEAARERLEWVFQTGGTPYAMYYRAGDDERFRIPPEWARFVRSWTRPAIIFAARKSVEDITP